MELRADIHAKAVLGDHRTRTEPLDLELRGAHVDLDHPVQERESDAAAVEHDLLPAETGAHERGLARRLAVVATEEEDREAGEEDENDDGDEPRHPPAPMAAGRRAPGPRTRPRRRPRRPVRPRPRRRLGTNPPNAVRAAAAVNDPITLPSPAQARRGAPKRWPVGSPIRLEDFYFPFQVILCGKSEEIAGI